MTHAAIRLGLMPPLTGLVHLYGPEISWAGQIAVQEVNAQGGVLGRPLELIIEDDGSMPESALRAASKLLDGHGCQALIGNLLSNSRIAVADQVAEPRQVPYLNFSFSEGSIRSRYFFHFAALPNQQIEQMIPYMFEGYGPKMYFAGNNYEWPRGSIDAGRRVLEQLGGEVVGEGYYPIGTPADQLEALLDDVARAGANVFVPYFAGTDQINLLTRFAERGLKQRMAVVMGHYDEAMVRFLRPEVREGLYSSNTFFMSVDTPTSRAYFERLVEQPEVDGIWPEGNGVLTNFGEGTYACVKAYAQALNAAGSLETEAVLAALARVRVASCQGEVVMDPVSQHAAVNAFLARCRADGSFELMERFGRIPPVMPARYTVSGSEPLVVEPQPEAPLEPLAGQAGSVEGMFSQILDVADIAVIATDVQGQIYQTNRGAATLFGYGADELVGMSVHLLIPPHQRPFHRRALAAFVGSEAQQARMDARTEVTGYRKDGTLFPAEASIRKFHHGGEWVLVATLRDITQQKTAEADLSWQAHHDPLTRLPNRALIKTRLQHALERSRHTQQGVALLFIDLDNFKLVNDTYGHDAGDSLLGRVAGTLLEQVRSGDTVGRLGGDEFVVICDQVDSGTRIEFLAERINDALRLPMTLQGTEIVTTASIGLALGHGATHSAEDLLRNADAAMYLSKSEGRDSWRVFNAALTERSRQQLELVNGLRRAVEQRELYLVFQPIVAAQTGQIKGAEALLRWEPASGPVPPSVFIPIAEQSGAIVAIGRWVFEQACRARAAWQARFGQKAPYLSVNLSTQQLNDPQIVPTFAEIIEASGADPAGLLLEVTETSLFSDVENNLARLRGLAELGLKLAVDDFGTGYSSLAQLLRLPLATIKIDREFIDGLEKRDDARIITSAIIRMAKTLEKSLIAEGVENEIQLFELQGQRCDSIQGYYFFRPMDEAAFLAEYAHQQQQTWEEQAKVYYLIYVSKANTQIDEPELAEILKASRRFNRRHGLTGFLIYQRGYFMQMLEGRQEIVDSLMTRITADPRHSDVRVVVRSHSLRRLFNEWTMGYWDMSGSLRGKEEFMAWQQRTIDLLEAAGDARFCYAFFEALAQAS